MRLGPLALPVKAVAWAGSIAAHGLIVAAAWFVASSASRSAPPQVTFAFGDGGTDQSIYAEGRKGDILERVDPAESLVPSEAPFHGSAEPSDADDSLPPWSPATDLTSESNEAGTVGIASTFPTPNAGRPKFGGGSGKSAAQPGTSGGNPGESSARGGGGGGGTSEEGGMASAGTAGVPAGIVGGRLSPVYPIESRRRHEQGRVVIEATVDVDGSVDDLRVVEAPEYPRLIQAALDAARQARFTPAIEGGRPVASIVRIPIQFTLR